MKLKTLIFNKKFILSYLLILSFITNISSGIIEPDDNLPLEIFPPFNQSPKKSGTKFIFRFYIPNYIDKNGIPTTRGYGAANGQYIGIRFTPENSLFARKIKYHECSIIQTDYNINIPLIPLNDENNENVIYCKIESYSIENILAPGYNYKLTLTIKDELDAGLDTLISISVFTSTSNNSDENEIIDIGTFNHINIHPLHDKNIQYNSIAVLTPTTPVIENEVESNLNFDVNINFNGWFSWDDYIICINIPKNQVNADNPIMEIDKPLGSSIDIPTGDITTINLESDNERKYIGFFLDNNLKDNSAGDTLLLKFSGMKTKDAGLINEGNGINNAYIGIEIRYRNSYVICASQRITLTVSLKDIKFTVKHPETNDDGSYKFDVYKGGAFQIEFNIKSQKNVYNKYITIKQKESKKGQRVTFIASSCDFSDFNITSNYFNEIPKCNPIKIKNRETGKDNSNGIFFFYPYILNANKNYKLRVWMFFDECGSEEDEGTVEKVEIKFSLEMYNDIHKNKIAEKRFDSAFIFLKETITENGIRCYNTHMGDKKYNNGYLFNMEDYSNEENLLYREYFNWNVFDKDEEDENGKNILDNLFSEEFTPKFIYSNNKNRQLQNGKPLLLVSKITLDSGNNEKLGQFFPMGLFINIDGTKNAIKGKFFIKLSKNFFKKAEDVSKCYVSWAFGSPSINSKLKMKPESKSYPHQKYNFIVSSKEFFSDDKTALFKPLIDTSKIKDNYLESTKNEGWDSEKSLWSFGDDENLEDQISDEAPVDIYFALADTCHVWKDLDQKISSLYTPIEIIVGITGEETDYSRVMRFIKLYPETGVWHDNTINGDNNLFITSSNFIIKNHFAYNKKEVNDEGINDKGVCLLEISKGILDSRRAISTNFFLWIFMGSLLETEYSQPQSPYPIGNLPDTANAYGYSSQHSLNPNNFYAKPSKTQKSDITSPIYNIAHSMTSLYQTATTGYLFYLGSLIVIYNRVSRNSLYDLPNDSLLVPYYCPYYISKGETKPFTFGIFPAFIAGFGNFDSMTNFGNKGFDRIIGKQINDKQINILMLSDIKIYKKDFDSNIGLEHYYNTVKFINDYNKNLRTLNVWNSNKDTPCKNEYNSIDSFIFFFSEKITGLNNIYPSSNIPTRLKSITKSKKGNYCFYVYGKRFCSGIYGVTNDDLPLTRNVPSTGDKNPYLSININFEISPDLLVCQSQSDKFCPIDIVAFWGISSNHDMPSYVTNYLVHSFVLDYHIYTEYINNNKPTSKLGQSLAFKNDPAIYVKIIFESPFTTAILNNTILSFTIKDIKNAYCSVQSSNVSLPSVNCVTNEENGEISCKLVFSSMIYNIFCYDLHYDSSERFYFNNFKLSLPNLDAYSDLGSMIFHDTNEYFLNKIISSNEPVSPSIQRNYITSPYNLNSYSKLELFIDLKRPAHPGMEIEIIFDKQVYFDEKSECQLSLDKIRTYSLNDLDIDQFWTKGNAIIYNCKIVKVSSSGTPIYKIVAKLDNKLYKIENLSNFAYIYIWPFRRKVNEKYAKLSVTVNGKYILSDIDNSDNNIYFSNVNEFADLLSFSATGSMHIKFSSNIVGDLSDYTFTITSSEIEISLVQIFFPRYINFECEECVKCYELTNSGSTKNIRCNFEDKNILNVFISLNNEIPYSFIVTGIINPKKKITPDIFYNLVKINFQGKRQTYYSSTSYIDMTLTDEPNIEHLKFFYVNTAISDNNPRNMATYTFRFSFDYANKWYSSSNLPFLRDKSLVDIYFPSDYHLYINENPTETKFLCYYSDGSNDIINVNAKILGRKIRIVLTQPTKQNIYIKYIEIVINNIKNPERIKNQNKYTGYFKIVCLNSPDFVQTRPDSQYYYITGINSNTFRSNLIIDENERSGEYNWHRGIMIKTNSTYEDKLILNVLSENKVYDFIFLQPGRYTKAYFVTSIDNEKKSKFYLKPSYATVTFSSQIVQTLEEEYTIPSLLIEPYAFYIGVPCTTNDGIYVVSPKIKSEKNSYLSPPSIIVNVRQIETAKVEFIQNDIGTAPLNGKSRIYYYLTAINFDELPISWTKNYNQVNKNVNIVRFNIPKKTITDKNKKLSEVFSTATIELIEGRTETIGGSYKFMSSYINRCYELIPKELSIREQASYPFINLDPNYKLNSDLTIKTSENDDTLLSNEIKFDFNPPLQPSFILCELYCPYLTPDNIDNLKFYDFDTMNEYLRNVGQNYFRKYSSNYFYVSQESGSLIFPNVIKGYNYNAKCVFQTTQSDNDLVTYKEYSLISENLHSAFPAKTQCNTFYFISAINKEIQEKYINYCQYIVGKELGIEGCAICSDCSGKIISPGFSLYFPFNCLKEQCYNYSNNSLLNEMYDLAEEFNTNGETEKYEFTICVTSNRICSTQIKDENLYSALNQFVNEVKDNLKANELFEIDYNDNNYIIYSSFFQNKIYSEYKINIDDVEIEFIEELNSNGHAIIKASYNMEVSYNILCFWRIKLSEESVPNIEEMTNCKSDETLCGVFVANYVGHQYKIPETRRRNIAEGIYSMYITCSHFVPSPVYFSEIKNIMTKEVKSVSFSENFFYINYIYLLIYLILLY